MLDPIRTALARSESRGHDGGGKILTFAGLRVKGYNSLGG